MPDNLKLSAICPTCKTCLDGHTNLDGKIDSSPSENDVTVCFNCGELCKFGKDLELIRISSIEFIELPLETRRILSDAVELLNEHKQMKAQMRVQRVSLKELLGM